MPSPGLNRPEAIGTIAGTVPRRDHQPSKRKPAGGIRPAGDDVTAGMLLDAFLRADEEPAPGLEADPSATSQLRAAAGLVDEPAVSSASASAEAPITTFSHGYREAPEGGSRTLFVAHGVEERVSRLERLLSADLDRLGAAAVSDRLGHLRTAVEALTKAVTTVATERAVETEARLEELFAELQTGMAVLSRQVKGLSEQVSALAERDPDDR